VAQRLAHLAKVPACIPLPLLSPKHAARVSKDI
jgi:hypothetical protein